MWNATGNAPATGAGWGPLLPELARLERLQKLAVIRRRDMGAPGIPPAWGQPGAFKSLLSLQLVCQLDGDDAADSAEPRTPLPDLPTAAGSAAALPAVHPGALPSLQQLHLQGAGWHGPLPPSWGSSRGVLPALRSLTLSMACVGALPSEWAAGFAQLEHLSVTSDQSQGCAHAAGPWAGDARTVAQSGGNGSAPAHLPAVHPLPATWASASAFPRLRSLHLALPCLSGTLPDSWHTGGFPVLRQL